MKKSILALAVLGAFAGAASAQSSVTLYGVLDANVTYRTAGDGVAAAAGPGDSKWLLNDGGGVNGRNTSRWGLRGSEDLGGGLSGIFVLEQGYNLDTGIQSDATRAFNRQAFVGVKSSTLGQVTLGRQYALTYPLMAYLDPSDKGETKIDETAVALSYAPGTAAAITGLGAALPLFQEAGTRIDNSVMYSTPNFGGFVGSALVGAGEGAPVARYQGVRGTFGLGPFAIGATYEEFDGTSGTYNKVGTIGANYNFGFAKLFAGYQSTKDFGTQATGIKSTVIKDHEAYTVGASAPFGQFLAMANYTEAKYKRYTGGDFSLGKYAIAVEYRLSKRTLVYSAYSEKTGDLKDYTTAKREVTLLGVNHFF